MAELTSVVPRFDLGLGSGRCHVVQPSWGRDLPLSRTDPLPGSVRYNGALCALAKDRPQSIVQSHDDQKFFVEKLWREFLSDPSQWWDNRLEKVNPRYPDFKHKKTKESLWLNGKWNPPWVEAQLAAMVAGTLQEGCYSWNRKMVRYIEAQEYDKTIKVFQDMLEQGIEPDSFTFVRVLSACTNLQALEEGRDIHAKIKQSGFETNMYVGSCLVDMYAKCGIIEDAETVFNKMPTRDVITWSAMILGYVKSDQGYKALELYRQMQEEGIEPNSVTFVGVLNACASVVTLEEGRLVHEQIIKNGCESVVCVGNSLVDMYAKCGSLEDAWKVFVRLPTRDVVAWSALIQGYVKCGQGPKALELSKQMLLEGVEPDSITFVGLLNACASTVALEEGRHFHKQIIQRGYQLDVFVVSSLIDMYAKCGCIDDAWNAFETLPTRDVVVWSAMIQGYAKSGLGKRSLELYQQMQQDEVEPNPVTFVGLLNACASLGALEEGRRVHEQIIQKGYESVVFVGSRLIDMYLKCGSIDDAYRAFNKMPTRNVLIWSEMIIGYVKFGQDQKALELYQQMHREGVEPDSIIFVEVLKACGNLLALREGRSVHEKIIESGYQSSFFVSSYLIDMYAKCGSIEDAQIVFDNILMRNLTAWNAIIQGYVTCCQGLKALELFRQMQQEGVEADHLTFLGVVNACASVGGLEEGKRIHEQIAQSGYGSCASLVNSLVDMYAKCGSIDDAQRVFNKMNTHDVGSWNSLLGGYAIHGRGWEALKIFNRMCKRGVKIDGTTFISVLSACSHAGLVDDGLRLFQSMSPVHGLSATADHYACKVDLLGRAGRLHEAEVVIKTMSCEPDASVWISLLCACRDHCNGEMAELIAKQILELDPGNAMGYVLLSNIYAASGKWDKVSNIQQQKLERGVTKQAGCTWIEVNNKVHSFILDDKEHPRIIEIREEVERLSQKLLVAGHVPDTRFELHLVEDEEKDYLLHPHSELLAIAFGLIRTPPGSSLQIFKNLQVCGDCHTAIKFITKIVGREIIVRDMKRFHYVKDGVCSCGDYW